MATPRPLVPALVALLALVPVAVFGLGRGTPVAALSAALSAVCVVLIAASVYWLFDGELPGALAK